MHKVSWFNLHKFKTSQNINDIDSSNPIDDQGSIGDDRVQNDPPLSQPPAKPIPQQPGTPTPSNQPAQPIKFSVKEELKNFFFTHVQKFIASAITIAKQNETEEDLDEFPTDPVKIALELNIARFPYPDLNIQRFFAKEIVFKRLSSMTSVLQESYGADTIIKLAILCLSKMGIDSNIIDEEGTRILSQIPQAKAPIETVGDDKDDDEFGGGGEITDDDFLELESQSSWEMWVENLTDSYFNRDSNSAISALVEEKETVANGLLDALKELKSSKKYLFLYSPQGRAYLKSNKPEVIADLDNALAEDQVARKISNPKQGALSLSDIEFVNLMKRLTASNHPVIQKLDRIIQEAASAPEGIDKDEVSQLGYKKSYDRLNSFQQYLLDRTAEISGYLDYTGENRFQGGASQFLVDKETGATIDPDGSDPRSQRIDEFDAELDKWAKETSQGQLRSISMEMLDGVVSFSEEVADRWIEKSLTDAATSSSKVQLYDNIAFAEIMKAYVKSARRNLAKLIELVPDSGKRKIKKYQMFKSPDKKRVKFEGKYNSETGEIEYPTLLSLLTPGDLENELAETNQKKQSLISNEKLLPIISREMALRSSYNDQYKIENLPSAIQQELQSPDAASKLEAQSKYNAVLIAVKRLIFSGVPIDRVKQQYPKVPEKTIAYLFQVKDIVNKVLAGESIDEAMQSNPGVSRTMVEYNVEELKLMRKSAKMPSKTRMGLHIKIFRDSMARQLYSELQESDPELSYAFVRATLEQRLDATAGERATLQLDTKARKAKEYMTARMNKSIQIMSDVVKDDDGEKYPTFIRKAVFSLMPPHINFTRVKFYWHPLTHRSQNPTTGLVEERPITEKVLVDGKEMNLPVRIPKYHGMTKEDILENYYMIVGATFPKEEKETLSEIGLIGNKPKMEVSQDEDGNLFIKKRHANIHIRSRSTDAKTAMVNSIYKFAKQKFKKLIFCKELLKSSSNKEEHIRYINETLSDIKTTESNKIKLILAI